MVGSIRGVAAVVVAVTLGGAQAATAQNPPPKPKLVNPIYGEAQIQITKPATKVVGGDVVTTVLVKNVDKAPIAGFVAEEYWYDRAGNPLGGGTYRHPRPIQVGEVIVCTFKTPKSTKLDRNQVGFSHSHGPIKKTIVPKLDAPKPAK
jgi:hypothetical protein